ncbi:cold-shock protein [Sinorhizobium numidicum]|uniref:Cold-shock protein n=1 Tax=Sinorhizobium numidicum TaxID=680248 RepID=A0ABY8CPC5_9HYPH|nr:cold-shock protein [Sinorhizobium numidicum]WEX74506.1 cold-shock protein [Sinorhizobium numidicum]WEX80496.1 cold-shock protein [Sinorhizobium numidicum]
MSSHRYRIGDQIVLKDAPSRFLKHDGPCRIVGVLPAHNEPQYRVRFDGESFERCISESDIENQKSPPSPPEADELRGASGRSWVASLATKAKR